MQAPIQAMADPWKEAMDLAEAVARKAGKVIRDALQNDIKIMTKSSSVDLVTQTDQKVEQLIITAVKEKFPTHSFIGEESVAAGLPCILTDNPTWIIDPVDGTTNFVHGFPFVAVSIGFAVNKELEFGVVYSCVEDKMYTGRRGKGAYCDGEKLQVSDITVALCELNMCLVASGAVEFLFERQKIHGSLQLELHRSGGCKIFSTMQKDVDGGPFDLMSRRMVSANNETIARRIVKEIEIFPAERDDVVKK
ncbi:hypothetical protein GJAV_G00070220 [Gymnothorax javanicus]|nr:hypothetical protein GJAV_G00070220 [Gymnothorax javanicus]